MNENNSKKTLDVINQTIENTNYILESHPYTHIYNAIKKWLIVFSIFSFFQFICPCIAPYIGFYDTYANFYYPFFRVSLIILSIMSILVYFKEIKKPILDVRQKDFLYLFLVFIVMASLIQILGPITYYFNQSILLHLTKTLPLALIITPLGIVFLIYYTKQYKLLIPLFVSVVLSLFYLSWNSYFLNHLAGNMFYSQIDDMLINFMLSGLPTVLCFFITLIILKKN